MCTLYSRKGEDRRGHHPLAAWHFHWTSTSPWPPPESDPLMGRCWPDTTLSPALPSLCMPLPGPQHLWKQSFCPLFESSSDCLP